MATPEIDQVIKDLDEILNDARNRKSKIGFFAALYRVMTVRVKQGVENGEFEDGHRMDHMDAVFANRYVDAVKALKAKEKTTRSWRIAFEAAEASEQRLILQHLLLGMNAHINLDLGIAAAKAAPGDSIHALKADYDKINDLLQELLDKVQKAIGKHSPMMYLLDQTTGPVGDQILGFSFPVAREAAWMNALVLANMKDPEKQHTIDGIDRRTALMTLPIVDPGGAVGKVVEGTIVLAESKDVVTIIDTLLSAAEAAVEEAGLPWRPQNPFG